MVSLKLEFKAIPLPRKLFSITPNANVLPSDPTPAPAEISPVGFSSRLILIIFWFFKVPLTTSSLTLLKKFSDLILLILRLWSNSLKPSPSSIIKLFLITDSSVILFPKILIFSF